MCKNAIFFFGLSLVYVIFEFITVPFYVCSYVIMYGCVWNLSCFFLEMSLFWFCLLFGLASFLLQ